MFCGKCGTQLSDGERFCPNCGTEVGTGAPHNNAPDNVVRNNVVPDSAVPNNIASNNMNFNNAAPNGIASDRMAGNGVPGKQAGKKIPVKWIALSAAVILCIFAGFIAISNYNLSKKFHALASTVDSYKIDSFIKQKSDIEAGWEDVGIFQLADKKDYVKNLQEIADEAQAADNQLKDMAGQLAELEKDKEKYDLADSYGEYEKALAKCGEAIKGRDFENAGKLLADAENSLQSLIEDNTLLVQSKLELYKNIDISHADSSEKKTYNAGMEKVEQLAGKEEFSSLADVFEKLDRIAELYVEPENDLSVAIQQVDASDYPNIKLYTQMQDAYTGDVPENLDKGMFFVRKENANEKYVKQEIVRVTQLNQAEALNVNMVADVSGSMAGRPLNDAKSVMSDFISSVQFDAGDMVELTSFSTGVYLEQEFTDNASVLMNCVDNLETGDMTSLYDALYTAVTRTASRRGAKCVIAFTDGNDNYSSCSSTDVIDAAQRYHVPVFIIGIGYIDSYEVEYIAEQTGGFYRNVDDVGYMSDIYDEIYRQEKELYLIEFKDDAGKNVWDSSNIEVGYNSIAYGGYCQYSYTPNVLISVSGDAMYEDGPEAVVEGYMKGFADAMTNMDFSYISSYLKKGSNIYNTQKKYVTRGIAEELDSYEIVDVDYKGKKKCIVSTRETYYVQKSGKPLQLMTQKCKYKVVRSNGKWKITDFAGPIKVVSRINR